MRKENYTVSLHNKLPPLGALTVFEAAARHLNFTSAAAELNVTRVAVSQRIRALEDWLQISLFERSPNGLHLTSAGARYLSGITIALKLIADETQAVQAPISSGVLTVSAPTSIITYWLMPKLVGFREKHPEIDIRLIVADRLSFSDRFLDIDRENIDIAIRYGDGTWENTINTFLFRDEIYPMCAPEYVFRGLSPKTPGDLLNETLIFLEGDFHEIHTWPNWMASRGVDMKARKSKTGIYVNTYANQIQAALNGQGIALLGRPIIEDYLRKGRLIMPISTPPTTRHSWYLCRSKLRTERKDARIFMEWIPHAESSS